MCEGWSNRFFKLIGHAHPSIWRVIEWCQKEEATVRTIIQQDAVGNPPVKRTQQRPLPSSCVELGGTSDSITNISA
jgi:hypothetical protein